jgi:hypothetical protein
LTYLAPPPAPAPVIVMKDVGGIVKDYQAQTELYRQSDREVRIHECHSACTLALSLPNVCVYPDSIFKFHLAYNLRTKETDYGVSDEMYASYPAAVRARLGTLSRSFKVLTGAELIAAGIRDCNSPRIMMAKSTPAPAQNGALSHVWSNVMTAFGGNPTPAATQTRAPQLVATRKETDRQLPEEALLSDAPMPPPRPAALGDSEAAQPPVPAPNAPQPMAVAFTQSMPSEMPAIIAGAQAILPPRFQAYALIARLARD